VNANYCLSRSCAWRVGKGLVEFDWSSIMWRTFISIIVVCAATLAVTLGVHGSDASQEPEANSRMRVGVYDNRGIAIAYAASSFNPVSGKMTELEQARADGDKKRIMELEAWGQQHQRQLHRQGFGRMPVTDLIEPVKDRLPALAKELGVDVIAFECNYLGPNVEQVDITLDMVKLYNPSEQTMKWVEESMKARPVDLDEIDRIDEK
jgi:hypothetical protein